MPGWSLVSNQILKFNVMFSKYHVVAMAQEAKLYTPVIDECAVCAIQIDQLMPLGQLNQLGVTPRDVLMGNHEIGIALPANDDLR